MVLAAAGAVDHDQLVKSAEQVFGKVPDETPETSVASLVTKVSETGSSRARLGDSLRAGRVRVGLG
jgi:predicted Zn-dependent peptidase